MAKSRAPFFVLAAALSLASCGIKADIEPGQVPKICEATHGSDRFVIDPNQHSTRAVIGVGTSTKIYFIDQLTGDQRVLTSETEANYRCRKYAPEGRPA